MTRILNIALRVRRPYLHRPIQIRHHIGAPHQPQLGLARIVNRGKQTANVDFTKMSPYQFKLHFRFSLENAQRITNLLLPQLRLQSRGKPLSPFNMVCVALLQLSGAAFHRINALAIGISKWCMQQSFKRVVRALFSFHQEFIKFPSRQQMIKTSTEMFDKYGLPHLYAGIDGCHIRFQKMPRGCPVGQDRQLYWCRKQFYSINACFICNDKFFYHADVSWYGSAHDSRAYRRSMGRWDVERIERETGMMIVGNSAYQLSPSLMKPFGGVTTPTEAKFNTQLSRVRTLFTECNFGRLKARLPILREMRHHLMMSQRIIVVCCILHNIAAMLNDEVDDVTADDPLGRPYEEQVQMPPRVLPAPVDPLPAVGSVLESGRRKRFDYLCEFARSRNLPAPTFR